VICEQCGTDNPPGSLFCQKCGRQFEEEQTVPSSTYYPQSNKLFRCANNKVLGGVCSGLAIYSNMDVSLVRLLAILLFFASGTSLFIAYVIAWIIIPEAECITE